MRITNASLFQNFLRALEKAKTDTSDALDQLGDQKRVRYGSDDPAAAGRSLLLRGDLVRTEGYRRSVQAVESDLTTVDANLTEAFNALLKSRDLAIGGVAVDDGNAFRAQEISALRDSLLAVANTHQGGRNLLAGTDTLGNAYLPTGLYVGNDTEAEVEIGNGLTVKSTVDGSRAFEGAGNVFTTLRNLRAALEANDRDEIQRLGTEINDQIEALNVVRADIGSRLQLLDNAGRQIEDEQLRLQREIVGLEDISLEEVAVRLSTADTTANALSTAASRVLGRSLFDFFG